MGDLADLDVARAALEDAATDASDLRLIAQNHPDLRVQVAMHPAAYAGLLDWLESLGDPLLAAVVNVRRGADGGRRMPADERAILRQLPLAERRLAAVTRVLSTLESSGPVAVDYEFSELARNGQQARVRIDELSVNSGSGFTIEDGSCVVVAGTSSCLSDALDQQSLDDAISYFRSTAKNAGKYQSQAFEEATGIDLDEFLDKVESAAEAAAEAIQPDELGIIAVQEDGGWFVSATATVSDLQNQAGKALSAGLKAAQKG